MRSLIVTLICALFTSSAFAESNPSYSVFKGSYNCVLAGVFDATGESPTNVENFVLSVAKNGKLTGSADVEIISLEPETSQEMLAGKLTKYNYNKKALKYTARASDVFYNDLMSLKMYFSVVKSGMVTSRSAYGKITFNGEELPFSCSN